MQLPIRDEIWRTICLVRDAAVADRVVVLVKGELVFNGSPQALLADQALMQRTLGV